MVRVWSAAPVRVSREDQERTWNAYMRYCHLVADIPELHQQPKKHAMLHLLKDVDWHGNPKLYSNWIDEGDNKLLKFTTRTSSQSTLECACLHRMKALLRKEYRKRKASDMIAK